MAGEMADVYRELGALTSRVSDHESDIHSIAEDVRQTRHDTRNGIAAAEGRLTKLIREECNAIRAEQEAQKQRDEKKREATLTTWRWRFMAISPFIGIFVAYVLGRAG